MASAGELSVEVKARISDFTDKLNQVNKQAQNFSANLSTIGKKDFFAPVQKTLRDMRGDFKQIVQGIVLAQTFYQGLQLFKQLTAAVYEYTDSLDYARVTFSNLFRDASLGEEFVSVLQQYASRSPFDFSDVEKGARQLSAYGIEAKNLMYVMQGIGNLSAVTGDPQTFDTVSRAIGQIYAKGKLSAEEMRQLAEAGLNVKAVYERLGVDASNVAKANVDAGTAINAIIDTINDKYHGAMDAANMTMRGMMGNVKDVLLSTVSAVYEPAYKKMQRVLLGFQQALNQFQETFSTQGLAAAISEMFGPEVLYRIQQVIAIMQYLGNIIYQLLVPALKILGVYGQATVTVFGALVNVFGPILTAFAALLNSITQNAAAMRILQAALLGLAVMKIVGAFATFLSGCINMMQKAIEGAMRVSAAASQTLMALTAGEISAANGAVLAGKAWGYFSKALQVNPIILAISVILSLVAAIVGLRAVLGKTTDLSAAFSGTDFSEYLNNIKMGTGDLEKFNNQLDNTSDDIDDINDDLKKTKKAQEGLLSFDEVFKLPEKTDTSKDKDDGAAYNTEWPTGDFDDFKMPDIEPLDWRDLLPDLNSFFDWIKDWFEKQPWTTIGGIIAKGISSGIKAASKIPSKAVKALMDDLAKTAAKKADKFKIKEKMAELAKKVKAEKAKWKAAGEALSNELKTALEKELGPSKTKKLKINEKMEKLARDVAKGRKTWAKEGKELVDSLTKEIEKELGPEKTKKLKVKEKLEGMVTSAEKASTAWKRLGKEVTESLYGEIKSQIGGQAAKDIKLREKLEKIAEEGSKGSAQWKKVGKGLVEDLNKSINAELLKVELDGKSLEEQLEALAKKCKESGKSVTEAGRTIGKDFVAEVKYEASEVSKVSLKSDLETLAKSLSEEFKSAFATVKKGIAEGFKPSEIFKDIGDSFAKSDASTIFAKFGEKLKGAFTPEKIKAFLKTGLKDMGFTLIGEMIFDHIAEDLDANGQTYAANALWNIGPVIASGIGTALVSGKGFKTKLKGFGIGALWGWVFEELGNSLDTGDWSGTFDSIVGSFGVVMSTKLLPKLGKSVSKGVKGGSWAAAIGSMVSGMIFGSIEDSMRENGDEEGAQIVGAIDDTVSGALAGAGLGATIGSVFPGIGTAIGAVAGAIIGGLTSFLVGNWPMVQDWWNNTAAPFFQDLPGNIAGFFTDAKDWLVEQGSSILDGLYNGITGAWDSVVTFFTETIPTKIDEALTGADQWLSDPKYNPLAGLWNGIKEVWDGIVEFFGGIFGAILGFFTGDDTWLTEDGQSILNGLWGGIQNIWTTVSTWFTNLPTNIGNFFTNAGNWLLQAGQNILQGAYNGITNIWTTVSTWFTNLPTNIGNFFTNAGNWLLQAGKNILQGAYNGITNIWTTVSTWFTNLPTNVLNFFSNAGNWLINAGKNILSGFFNGITQKWEDVKAFFGGIGDWIVQHKGPEDYDKKLLVDAGKNIMSGLKSGSEDGFANVQKYVNGLGSKIQDAFKNASSALVSAGKDFIGGMLSGLKDKWTSAIDWVKEIPGKFKDVFSNATSFLSNAGIDVVKGLWDGLKSWFSEGSWNVIAWVKDIPNRIKNIFTYASSWLYNAGYSIIKGFWDGLKGCWDYVTGWISGIGDWIAEHKGPESYDRTLLIPNGTWIIEGLQSGLQQQFEEAKDLVESFGPQLQNAFAMPTLEAPTLTIGRTSIPNVTQAPATQYGTQEQEVPNPYLNTSQQNAEQKPILYVGTLIADKQGLRELKKKMDVIEAEQSRYR